MWPIKINVVCMMILVTLNVCQNGSIDCLTALLYPITNIMTKCALKENWNPDNQTCLQVAYSRVESRVAERSSPSWVSSRRFRSQVKSQVKSIIVKSQSQVSRVESRVAERSSPSRVSSRRFRSQVKSQVKSIIVKSQSQVKSSQSRCSRCVGTAIY